MLKNWSQVSWGNHVHRIEKLIKDMILKLKVANLGGESQ